MTPALRVPPPPPPRRRPRTLLLAAALLGALLAGCGPGVGGTGTGVTPTLERFGAESEPLCGADIAALLSCSGGTGTDPLPLADDEPARRVAGRADGQRIELQFACEGWRFDGQWGRAAAPLGARFYGSATNAFGHVLPATLSAGIDGNRLAVQLFDELGQPLSPPLTLRRLPAPATLMPQCP
ncbi:MAG: hypothetical protein KF683_18075 [Rubrivivax sp.]|nr:hypothetical protein [Rubrivivax sp.]